MVHFFLCICFNKNLFLCKKLREDSVFHLFSNKKNNISACAVDSYKAKDGLGDCEPCPGHSTAPSAGSAECQCDAGYYRAEDEGVEYACSRKFSNNLGKEQ